MHQNSTEAWQQDKARLSGKRLEIWEWLLATGKAHSDREVKDGMGFDDMNAVRPRLTELIKVGWAEERGRQIDPTTNKTVRLVKALPIRREVEQPAEPVSLLDVHLT